MKRALTFRLPEWVSLSALLALVLSCQPKEVTSAKIYMQDSNWDAAVEQLETALEMEPKNAEANYLLGQLYAREGRFDEMNKHFAAATEYTDIYLPDILAVREQYWIEKYILGVRSLDETNYERAESALTIAILIDSTKTDAYRKLALTYLGENKPQQALALYETLVKRHPNDINLLLSTGNLYYSQRQYARVIPILQKILAIDPTHRDALANIALSYDALGEAQKARDSYQAAIAANPSDPGLIFLFGVHHYKEGNFQDAIILFEQALTIAPDDFDSMSNIGSAYLSLAENIRKSLKDKQNAAPKEALALKNEAILNYQRAIPYLEKSLELQPDAVLLWRNLAAAYIYTGETQKGEQAFLKAEELSFESAAQ